MGKYVYVYYAGKDSDGGSNEAWGAWFGQLGDKLVDAGNPFGDGQAVHAGGVMPVQDKPVTGYSIVSAGSMDEAVELAKGCPLTSAKDGAVCVYEALPM
jgi:YCII-related domain